MNIILQTTHIPGNFISLAHIQILVVSVIIAVNVLVFSTPFPIHSLHSTARLSILYTQCPGVFRIFYVFFLSFVRGVVWSRCSVSAKRLICWCGVCVFVCTRVQVNTSVLSIPALLLWIWRMCEVSQSGWNSEFLGSLPMIHGHSGEVCEALELR